MSKGIELKPCPACGGYPEIGGNVDGTEVWIACGNLRKCRMGGPTRSTVEEAAQAWNDLPRALEWGSEPPSEPGFWWWELCGQRGVDLIQDPEKRVVKDYRTKWAGPIPEPQEAKR